MLTDTSVWIDHFRRGGEHLAARLQEGEVWIHSFVIGELSCGRLQRRNEILSLLRSLPHAPFVEHEEVLEFVEAERLMERGLGWIDVHLLASARLARIPLWTFDRRLAAAARLLGINEPGVS